MIILLIPNAILSSRIVKQNIKTWKNNSKTYVKEWQARRALSEKESLLDVRFINAGKHIVNEWK